MDDIEREAIRAEGLDPDDPTVLTALEVVRSEMATLAPDKLCHTVGLHYDGSCMTDYSNMPWKCCQVALP